MQIKQGERMDYTNLHAVDAASVLHGAESSTLASKQGNGSLESAKGTHADSLWGTGSRSSRSSESDWPNDSGGGHGRSHSFSSRAAEAEEEEAEGRKREEGKDGVHKKLRETLNEVGGCGR